MIPFELLVLLTNNEIPVAFAKEMIEAEDLMYADLRDLEYMQDRIDCWKEFYNP